MSSSIVAVGGSLGGLHAVTTFLVALGGRVDCPVAIVLHREPRSGSELRFVLQHATEIPVLEAEDKMPIEISRVYLAPPDYHLLVDGDTFALSVDAPVQSSRPSIDVFFESVADGYGDRAVGVLLTGSNHDGARGLAIIKGRGGLAFVQDPETAEATALPRAALAATPVDGCLAVPEIAERIAQECSRRAMRSGSAS